MVTTGTVARVPARIVLVGMMGSGKTTVGRLLAGRLGVPYLDNDELVVARTGMTAAQIVLAFGVKRLRQAESDALAEALAGDADAVVGVAAGAILEPETRSLIRAGGRVIWLRGRTATLVHRQGRSGWEARPRLARDMALWMEAEAEARSPLYAEVAVLVVDVDDRSPGQVVETILSSPILPGMYRAIVFDLDGLLVETETIWMEAKVQLFRSHGTEFSADDHRAVMGTSEEFTARRFARRFGLTEEHVPAIREEYLGNARRLFAAGVDTREGATEIIEALRGRVPLGLASNTRRELVDLILERAGLTGSFDAIATGDECRPKPEPDVYALACARLGVAPEVAVAIEDSLTGVRAAKAAGMTCFAVPSDSEVDLRGADLVVPSLLDLLEPRSGTS